MFSLDDIRKFINKYNPDGLIVDTNVLILFLIGSYDASFIEGCGIINNGKRKYDIKDFNLLKDILNLFKKIIITPQIIAELSNLSVTGGGIYGEKLISYLQTIIKFLKSVDEQHQRLDCLWGMELEIISRYGFTDMTMYELSRQTKLPILTDDLQFYLYSYGKIPIIKFADISNQPYQSVFTK